MEHRKVNALEAIITLVLFLLGFFSSLHFSSLVTGDLVAWTAANNWFDADSPRVFSNLTDSESDNFRTRVHPASSLLTHPPVQVIVGLFGVSDIFGVRILLALTSGLTLVLFYGFCRCSDVSRAASFLFSLLFAVSAAYMHWSGTPELFLFAALSITLLLFVAALGRRAGDVPWIIASAATLSITVTNWMYGLIAAFVLLDRSRFFRVTAIALVVVIFLNVVQIHLYSNAKWFLNPFAFVGEVRWTQVAMQARGEVAWTPLGNIWSLVVTTMIAPPPEMIRLPAGYMSVTNQVASLKGAGSLTLAATVLWVLLLAIVSVAVCLFSKDRRWVVVLFSIMALQCALHLFYGIPTFLYSLHFLPVLLGVVVQGYHTPVRVPLLVASAALVLLGGASNYRQFDQAVQHLEFIQFGPSSDVSEGYCR